MLHVTRWILVSGMGLGVACASRAPGTQPGDMSAAEHREHSRQHEHRADEHAGRYDPESKEPRPASYGSPGTAGEDTFVYGERTYNPTAAHKQHAAEHREHARQHEEAARALEGYEAKQCSDFPPATRKVCPLLHVVSRVEEIPEGARLVLSSGVSVEAVLAHMRCHHAFGGTRGHAGMSTCPLYLKGVEFRRSGEGAVEIVADDNATIVEIRKRSRGHIDSKHESHH